MNARKNSNSCSVTDMAFLQKPLTSSSLQAQNINTGARKVSVRPRTVHVQARCMFETEASSSYFPPVILLSF